MEHQKITSWDFWKGILIAIMVYIYDLINGFIEHNGGIRQMVYTGMTIILWGILGTGVSYFGNMFWRWLNSLRK